MRKVISIHVSNLGKKTPNKQVFYVSLEHLGKKPGSTKVFGKTPINFTFDPRSGGWFLILLFAFQLAYSSRIQMVEPNKLLLNFCLGA